MANPWQQFINLLPQSPVKVGTVTAVLSSGKAVVAIQGEESVVVNNTANASLADRVLVRDQLILSVTTALPSGTVDI